VVTAVVFYEVGRPDSTVCVDLHAIAFRLVNHIEETNGFKGDWTLSPKWKIFVSV
jgi:hypothetical protein